MAIGETLGRGAKRLAKKTKKSIEERQRRSREEREAYQTEFRKAKLRSLKKRARKEGFQAGMKSGSGGFAEGLGELDKRFSFASGKMGDMRDPFVDPFSRPQSMKKTKKPKKKSRRKKKGRAKGSGGRSFTVTFG